VSRRCLLRTESPIAQTRTLLNGSHAPKEGQGRQVVEVVGDGGGPLVLDAVAL
jgi:hypothetical protein